MPVLRAACPIRGAVPAHWKSTPRRLLDGGAHPCVRPLALDDDGADAHPTAPAAANRVDNQSGQVGTGHPGAALTARECSAAVYAAATRRTPEFLRYLAVDANAERPLTPMTTLQPSIHPNVWSHDHHLLSERLRRREGHPMTYVRARLS